MYNPSPPALSTIVENVFPSANIKAHLSRGLQSTSALVQHCTALALIKCLMKYRAVVQALQTVEETLNEGENGRWSARRTELEREVRRRVPDLQVVLAFAQQKGHDILQAPAVLANAADATQLVPTNHARNALLIECAERLLWLYHQLLPNLVSEARFDAGKLLQTTYAAESAEANTVTAGVDTLRHLHVLRLLRVSDQFSWSAKSGRSLFTIRHFKPYLLNYRIKQQLWHLAQILHQHSLHCDSSCHSVPAGIHPVCKSLVPTRWRRAGPLAGSTTSEKCRRSVNRRR